MDNQNPTIQNLKFTIAYSMYYEKFMCKFFHRVDKLICIILLLVGLSITAGFFNGIVAGFIIILCVYFLSILSASIKAKAARGQYIAYLTLFHAFDLMNIESIQDNLVEIEKEDSEEIDIFSHPARLAALELLGMTPSNGYTEEPRNLSVREKLILLFIGERVEYVFSGRSKGQITLASVETVKDNNAN